MEDLKSNYKKEKRKIRQRLKEFSRNNDYFYELCFCLLTPQSNARKCYEAIEILKKKDFQNNDINIEEILKTKTRFYNNKSRYLKELRVKYPGIKTKLKTKNPFGLREYLVNEINGMGYKEASHFLRNIGYRNLAILDRHILKHLKRLKVIEEIPKTISNKKYRIIEDKFKEFSRKINIPMDELDLLFWSMESGGMFR